MIRRRVSLAAAALLVAGAACRRDAVVVTPDLPDVAPPPPAAEASQFSVPLDYDFTAVLRLVDRVVPTKFGDIDSVRMVGNDDHKHYAFEAERGPFTAAAVGSLIHLKSTLAYTAKGFYKPVIGPTIGGGCGKGAERPRIALELATPLTLTENWHLQSHARLASVQPASAEPRDRCDVSILRFDVTDRVIDAAKGGITAHLGDIDQKIAGIDLHKQFTELWALLARPIRLTDGVWLQLGPQRLDIGTVAGSGHVLTVPVTLTAHPRIVTSEIEPTDSAVTLPALGHAVSASGFRVVIDGTIDYATASHVVGLALVDKQITQAGKTVTVTLVRVTPANKGRVALTVEFTGDAKGSLVFLGTPVIDSIHREVRVPDLDYDLETDSQLINSYTWLRSDALRENFRSKAHVPVDSALTRGRALLLDGLNRKVGDALTLSAKVDTVALRGLFVTRSGLVVRAEARGQARVAVRQR